jgi:DNA-binding NarL/FixJ family response regulator
MMAQNDAVLGEPLTPREAAVCALLTAGESAKEAGAALGISYRTVETHKWRIFKKMGVDNIVKLTRVVMMREIGKEEGQDVATV